METGYKYFTRDVDPVSLDSGQWKHQISQNILLLPTKSQKYFKLGI